MRYSGIQPQYFPRLHYFARILAADIFMVRDEVQFVIKHKYPNGLVDKSYQVHTPIKHSFGRYLLVVPTKHSGQTAIMDTKISDQNNWNQDHIKTLLLAYSKSLNFKKLYGKIEVLLNNEYENLADLNLSTIYWGILYLIGEDPSEVNKLTLEFVNKKLKTQKKFRLKKIKLASQTKAYKKFNQLGPNEKILLLCQEIGATEDYCGGTGIAAYVDHNIFKDNGIKITVQDWKCREYLQRFSKHGFIPNLSIIDLLMNVPLGDAQNIIAG
ncbi:MAG: WbqC family protein [bacterium]|nr:WbqC family protein [bacterium]